MLYCDHSIATNACCATCYQKKFFFLLGMLVALEKKKNHCVTVSPSVFYSLMCAGKILVYTDQELNGS